MNKLMMNVMHMTSINKTTVVTLTSTDNAGA